MKNLFFLLGVILFFTLACSNSNPENTSNENTTSTTNNTEPTVQTVAEIEDVRDDSTVQIAEVTEKENNLSELPPPPQTTTPKSTTGGRKPIIEPQPTNPDSEKDPITEVNNNTISGPTPVAPPTTTPRPDPIIETKPTDVKPPRPSLSHSIWDNLMRAYVDSRGDVNYAGLKKEKRKVEEYLKVLESNAPDKSWSKKKEMAYWINLYNAFTINTILEKYPVKSIMNIDNGKVWDTRKINIGGKYYTLNQIEKDMLLKRFKDPRVHFAVNCAAASCPPLLNKAWTEDNLERYLELKAKEFINNTAYNTISSKSIVASQIFNWYASDFGGSDKIVSYFQKYSNTTIRDNAKVTFAEYKWNLNMQ